MQGLFDPWYPRSSNPLGNYAIVRTELFDSKKRTADQFFSQYVIAVHPVEVKIPFVLKNIPLPTLPSGAK